MFLIFLQYTGFWFHRLHKIEGCFIAVNLQGDVKPISGRVDRASATEAVDTGSIPGRVKPKTIKIGIHSFPA